jgi:uncharacterized Zn-finger protein
MTKMARKAPISAPAKAPKAAPKRTGKVKAVSPTVAAATPGRPLAVPPPEIITVRSKRVACDGVGGALGHPRVYLEMGEADFVECTYCDRRFVLAAGTEGPESEYAAPGVYEGSHGH